MAVNKVILGDQTLIDLTADSVTPDKLFKGITAHNMKGESIVGTMEGGSTPSEPSDNTAVIFADYDGNLIDTWTWDEVATKTALPTPPAHTGLVFEGWNWTLEDIKTDTTGQVITVGPYYHTASGLTEIDIHLDEVTGKYVAWALYDSTYNSIDWGDGSSVISGVDYPDHTYSNYGTYTIKINNLKRNPDFSLQKNNTPNSGYVMNTSIKAIRFAALNWNSSPWAVQIHIKYCYGCEYITIPKQSRINVGEGMEIKQLTIPHDANFSLTPTFNHFPVRYAYNLKYLAIPKNYEKIIFDPSSDINGCTSLISVYIPQNITMLNRAFYECSSLKYIKIPSSIQEINGASFRRCAKLEKVIIPYGVTTIGANVTGARTFQDCASLSYIEIPSSVTSLGTYAFWNWHGGKMVCNSTAKIESYNYRGITQTLYDFSGCGAIPELNSEYDINPIENITAIIVPDALYDTWITANNWSIYASKIVKASEVQ